MAEQDRELPRGFTLVIGRSDSSGMVRLRCGRARSAIVAVTRAAITGSRFDSFLQELVSKSFSKLASCYCEHRSNSLDRIGMSIASWGFRFQGEIPYLPARSGNRVFSVLGSSMSLPAHRNTGAAHSYVVENENSARKLARENLRRGATAKRRIGVAYELLALVDPRKCYHPAESEPGIQGRSETKIWSISGPGTLRYLPSSA